jgi:hypothetical protein
MKHLKLNLAIKVKFGLLNNITIVA